MEAGYKQKTGSDFGIERVDGAAVTLPELRNILQAAPFLATSRLVLISEFGARKPEAEAFAKVLQSVPDTTVAIFYDAAPDKRTGYFKALSEHARTVEFAPLAGPKLTAWVEREAARLGGSIPRQVAVKLIAMAGEDQWALSAEIAKLVAHSPEVTPEIVDELIVPRLQVTIFELVDGMVAGRAGLALGHYRTLLQLRTSEIYILTMIQWQLRNLLLAAEAGPMPHADLAKAAGIGPFVAGKAQAKARTMGVPAVRRAFIESVECERQIKTGAVPAELAVERLITTIAGIATAPG